MKETTQLPNRLFSQRIGQVPRSFIRDILKAANAPGVISFAGGLPNKEYFPVEALREAAIKVLNQHGSEALQYSTTEGLLKLREQIAASYANEGLMVSPQRILITTGSQQALDLTGKVFIDANDGVIIEKPAYLGAIQAFSMYEPQFIQVPLLHDGLCLKSLNEVLDKQTVKLIYVVPNFQNPSSISYSEQKRQELAKLIIENELLLIEDDPYGAIRFEGQKLPSIFSLAPKNTILLGTFSKTVAPGFRIGWMVAPSDDIYEKLVIAKQAADLHTDIFSQRVISQYLTDNEVQKHISTICNAYGAQAKVMHEAILNYFPKDTFCLRPQGGMFCWAQLPEDYSSMQLFTSAITQKVAIVPGTPFFPNQMDSNCVRLNFSCSSPHEIVEGIRILGNCLASFV